MFNRSMKVLLAAALALALVPGCKESKKQAPKPAQETAKKTEKAQQPAKVTAETGPVAKVNGVPIDRSKFQAELDKITQGGARKIPEDRLKKIKDNILNRLIDEELLRQEIEKQGIVVTSEELEAEFQRYKSRFKSDQQFQNYLKHGRTSIAEIKARLKKNAALTKLLTKLGKLAVTDEDIEKAYKTGIRMYTEPERVHAFHILIKVPQKADAKTLKAAEKKAMEVIKQLKAGKDFAELAKKYSDDALTKKNGGDLNYFRRGVMVPAFEKAAFALKPGEYTKKPVRTPFGFHIIKVVDHKPERVKPLEEVKDQIARSLKNRNMFRARRELLDKLKKTAKIERFLDDEQAGGEAAAKKDTTGK